MIDHKEIPSGEGWELFTRDLLSALGFVVESDPNRGADRGRDMVVTEQLAGTFANYRFRWLVSCKHFADSGRAVSEDDERNILERLKSFKADGFMGVYSTLPTNNLSTRLEDLRANGDIRDFRILDGRAVERYLLRVGFSSLLMRFYPESYRRVRPLHAISDKYVPLPCKKCGKDLLEALFTESYTGLVGYARKVDVNKVDLESPLSPVQHVYVSCKGKCDQAITKQLFAKGLVTGWDDISDLATPIQFLRFVFGLMNSLRDGSEAYTDGAYEELLGVVFALSQKVLREATEEERVRVSQLDAAGLF